MDEIEYERRLRKLAVREGMTFATLISLDGGDRAALSASIVSRFDPAAVYTEREVNDRLKAWLAGAGSMFGTDHVNLRRLLVDTQVLRRTSDCTEYRLQPEAAAAVPAELAAIDAAAIVADARNDAEVRRSARKAAWMKQTPSAST